LLAVVVSAGMTAFAGVFYAFYYNNLFPEQVFSVSRSIEIILAPIIGGVGTLFGTIVGVVVYEIFAEGLRLALATFDWDVPGVRQLVFGLLLLIVVVTLPEGVWPWLARKLGLTERKS
jgi:branched-chain amino acid transport system permease protein